MNIVEFINEYGFPIVACFGMGYLIYYVWIWTTKEIKPVVTEANNTLISLVDRIRMLDNDLIRLNQKIKTIISLTHKEKQLVRETGLEPVQISPADFKSAAATDYATLALTGPPDRIRTCNVPPSRANAGYKPGVLPLNYRRKNFK